MIKYKLTYKLEILRGSHLKWVNKTEYFDNLEKLRRLVRHIRLCADVKDAEINGVSIYRSDWQWLTRSNRPPYSHKGHSEGLNSKNNKYLSVNYVKAEARRRGNI